MDVSHIFPLCCCNFLHTTTSTSTISAGRVPDAPLIPPSQGNEKNGAGRVAVVRVPRGVCPQKDARSFARCIEGCRFKFFPFVLVNYISLSLDWQALVLPSVLWLVSCMMTSSLKSLKAPVIDNKHAAPDPATLRQWTAANPPLSASPPLASLPTASTLCPPPQLCRQLFLFLYCLGRARLQPPPPLLKAHRVFSAVPRRWEK
jgi:hypothetical protein